MKHYGEYDREPVILLGYNKPSGRMLLIPLPQLNEVQQQFLANIVKKNLFANEPLIPLLQRETYNGSDAFTYFSSMAVQIPLHFVKIADREQAEAWTGTSAQYSERVLEHPFQRLVLGDRPPRPVAPAEAQTPIAASMQPAPVVSSHGSMTSNDDLAAIRQMMASVLERLAQVEQNQLAQVTTPPYPNLGPFAAQNTDASGKAPPPETISEV